MLVQDQSVMVCNYCTMLLNSDPEVTTQPNTNTQNSNLISSPSHHNRSQALTSYVRLCDVKRCPARKREEEEEEEEEKEEEEEEEE